MISHHEPMLLIVPHIDFRVDTAIYGRIYKRLANLENFPETFIILGVGHRCPCEFSSCPLNYETIFGRVETDADLWNTFQGNCSIPLPRFPASFDGEHSIEFVVAWLQAIQRLSGKNHAFKILPMLLNGLHEYVQTETLPQEGSELDRVLKAFQKMLEKLDPKKTCIIASIDGCHVGPRFSHPFIANEPVQNAVKTWEATLWSLCRSDRIEDFFRHISSIGNGFYFDGVGVLTLLLKMFHVQAIIEANALWHEDKDQSLVTFAGGVLSPLT